MRTILDEPTTDDALMLAVTINEWYRASLGRFERIYPHFGPESTHMMNMIDSVGCDGPCVGSNHPSTPRYYDALLHQFIQRFGIPFEAENHAVSSSIAELKEPSASRPSKLGDYNFRALSKTLGISVKGLLFVTKLAEQ